VVLDVDEAGAASRRETPGDRVERAGAEFHAAVRDAYRTLASDRGWVVLDGSAEEAVVAAQAWELVEARLEV
jgi:thymidylate kinase